MNLWRVTKEYKEVEFALEEALQDESLELAKEDLLKLYAPLVQEKAEEVAKYVKNIQALADMQKAQAKELSELAAANKKRAERIMDDLTYALNAMGIGEVHAGPYKFKFKKGSTVVDVDMQRLPEHYMRVKEVREPDKVQLAKELKAGVEIDGAKLVKNPDKLELK